MNMYTGGGLTDFSTQLQALTPAQQATIGLTNADYTSAGLNPAGGAGPSADSLLGRALLEILQKRQAAAPAPALAPAAPAPAAAAPDLSSPAAPAVSPAMARNLSGPLPPEVAAAWRTVRQHLQSTGRLR